MMRVLAFFGAFNPPTQAHLNLAYLAMLEAGAEQVIFVPSRSVYIRNEQGKDFAYSDRQRLDMLQKAAENRSWMAVTDWEIRQDHQPRSYETLCHLRESGYAPILLMGSDKLPELEHGWLHVDRIAKEFGIVCLTRGKDQCVRMIREDSYLKHLEPYIRVVETPEETRGISSTEVRRRIREIQRLGKELKQLVPEEILPLPEPQENP